MGGGEGRAKSRQPIRVLVSFPFLHSEPHVSSERTCRKLPVLGIWLVGRVSCQRIRPLDSGKQRPPWPAVWPAEPADAVARAEGPALPGPLPGLLEPKCRSWEAWLGRSRACCCSFSSAQSLPLRTQRDAWDICKMGELVPHFSSFYLAGFILWREVKPTG